MIIVPKFLEDNYNLHCLFKVIFGKFSVEKLIPFKDILERGALTSSASTLLHLLTFTW